MRRREDNSRNRINLSQAYGLPKPLMPSRSKSYAMEHGLKISDLKVEATARIVFL